MKLTALFREDAINHNRNQGPSAKNPGGGLATKCYYLQRALPQIRWVTDVEDIGKVSLIDVLYFSGGNTLEEKERRIDAYRKQDGFKILWTSDFEIFRWLPEHRSAILDKTDIIAANSPFMLQLLEKYFDYMPVCLLTDCIDTEINNAFATREPIIYACSQILLEKGIDQIISLYKGISTGTQKERTLNRMFAGSSSTWGISIKDQVSFDLELDLEQICDLQWSMPNTEVQQLAQKAWIYVSFAKFETFGYAMVEAMLGGCTIFCTPHLAYKERIDAGVAIQVADAHDCRHKLKAFLEENQPTRNDAAIQFVHENYSLDVFRKQFKEIVGAVYGL